jgi:hypothetical protein
MTARSVLTFRGKTSSDLKAAERLPTHNFLISGFFSEIGVDFFSSGHSG